MPYDWERYRTLRRALPISVIAVMLIWFLVSLFSQRSTTFFFTGGIVSILLLVWFFSRKLSQWPCPRCGKPFHGGRISLSGKEKKCAFCSLPLEAKQKYRPMGKIEIVPKPRRKGR